MIPSCPQCGTAGMPLMFGLPMPAAQDAAAHGQLALGGCLVSDDAPNWQCPNDHRWFDDDERVWDERLLAVLVAHGYQDLGTEEQ